VWINFARQHSWIMKAKFRFNKILVPEKRLLIQCPICTYDKKCKTVANTLNSWLPKKKTTNLKL
jgi:hypothetical protein